MSQKIIIGITQGDSNGIGYEVIIKSLMDARIMDACTPVVYGSSRTFGLYKKKIQEAEQLATNIINAPSEAHPKRVNIINAVPDSLAVEPGQPTADAAKAAVAALEAAVKDLKSGKIDALVTAPINKHTVAESGFKFTGHTEYLINEFGAKDGLMFLCSDHLRIGLVTNHLPVAKVGASINQDVILSKLKLMNESLKRDFLIVRPKIAVLSLNPHSGDGGSLGNEEIDTISPAVAKANNENIMAFGPYPADGFFGTNMQTKFDAVLAMYHDQGLIPFKALSFDTGINYTAGLNIVRTSPDHGTAYDIAGQDEANHTSMLNSIYAAIDICNNRKRFDEMNRNPMESKHFEGPKYERTILPE